MLTYIHNMALSKKTVGVIIGLIVVSVSGLVVVQTYLLDYAMELKEQAFRRNVLAALNSAVQRLETSETVGGVFHLNASTSSPDKSGQRELRVVIVGDDSLLADSLCWLSADALAPVRVDSGKLFYDVEFPQRVRLQAFDPLGGNSFVILDTFCLPGQYQVELPGRQSSDDRYMFQFRTDSGSFVFESDDGNLSGIMPQSIQLGQRQAMVSRVIDRLTLAESKPIAERVSPAQLDSVLAISLDEAGIDLAYAFGVQSARMDSLPIARPRELAAKLKASEFRASLFPHDIFAARDELVLFFPGRAAYLWRQLGPMLLATLVLMLVLVGCFVYTIRTIIIQKRLAGNMVSFINNMTHEFKTPISTVALASEAIMRPDIISQEDKVARYNRMIQDENRRMRGQVEKILQMAVLEEGDYELEITDVDVHQVLQKAVDNIALQVTSRKGTITRELNAKQHTMRADPVHLANVIHNVLDNANKYSRGAPEINVSTFNNHQQIFVRITDHGIGLSDEDQKMVFDKYYRVPSGNVHDVKGFGLGLSYVKLMVEAHGGKVSLTGKAGAGTQVEMSFPIAGHNQGKP